MRYFYRKNIEWGLIKSNEIEFIMPSNPIVNIFPYEAKSIKERIIFPITPHLCLIPKPIFTTVENEVVENINKDLKNNAEYFYFSKNTIV
jgi:hypothetical protein